MALRLPLAIRISTKYFASCGANDQESAGLLRNLWQEGCHEGIAIPGQTVDPLPSTVADADGQGLHRKNPHLFLR
eukprot:scaffold287116_cov60-Attheya_sp.AAC.3